MAGSDSAGSHISLYMHIPFCRRLCWFCACRTQGTQSIEPVVAYLLTMQDELALLARHLPEGVKLSRMHWGGGTPTLLNAAMIADLAGAVAEVLPFAPDAEFSVEVDPNEFDQKRVDALAAAGMTRASIGVQDFDREIQETIGRQQGFEITRDTTQALRAAGIASLNADILFGLPHQTNQRVAATVQQLLTLAPDRVALYGYAHVPWMARRQSLIPTEALPPRKSACGFSRPRASSLTGTATVRSASTTSPRPAIRWRLPRSPDGCGGTSRAIRMIRQRC